MKRQMLPSVLTFCIAAGFLCLPRVLFGQQSTSSINPAALGFVFDSGYIRPILGVPGASLLGTRPNTGLDWAHAIVSPDQSYALGLAGEPHGLKLIPLSTAGASAFPINGALAVPDMIALSPTGASAALYAAGDRRLQVLTGLPDSPRVLRELPAAIPDGELVSLAVADDGQAVLAAVADQMLLISSDGIPRRLPFDGPISAIAFRPRTHDAIASGRNHVALILRTTQDSVIQAMAVPENSSLDPLAVSFSLDGSRAFVADSNGTVIEFDLSAASAQSFSCECKITGLHRLAGNAVFRLTDSLDKPLLLFDGDALQPRIVFVPTASAGEKQ
jgi:hypothetical protein